MKFIVIIISIFFVKTGYTSEALINILEIVEDSFEVFVNESVSPLYGNTCVDSCDSAFTRDLLINNIDKKNQNPLKLQLINQIAKKARNKLFKLRLEVESYLRQPKQKIGKGNYKNLVKTNDIVNCMIKKSADISYLFKRKDDTASSKFVLKVPKYVMKFYGQEFIYRPQRIIVFDMFWYFLEKQQISLLVHEFSHLCGTEDIEYFNNGEHINERILSQFGNDAIELMSFENRTLTMFRKSKIENWYLNADNYRLWSNHSFCLPNIDCDNLQLTKTRLYEAADLFKQLSRKYGYDQKQEQRFIDYLKDWMFDHGPDVEGDVGVSDEEFNRIADLIRR